MSSTTPSRPLNIAIVGAGLGGLAAAIALRRQGHLVKVYESSLQRKDIGTAIVVPPNSMRVLEKLGYNLSNLRSSENRGIVAYNADGSKAWSLVYKDQATNYGAQGCMCHRSDLYDELKRLALGEEGAGTPVELHFGTEIVDCDPEAGRITTKAGQQFEADVIIAADGIRSTLRTIVVGHPAVPPPTGICAFRWMADASKLEGRPELDWVLKDGMLGGRLVIGPNYVRSCFIYPCRDRTLMNVTMMHRDKRDQDQQSWYSRVTRDEMLEEYKDFGHSFQAFLELAEGPINRWQMRVVPVLPTWTKGRLALLGDAAHATFPTLGQGAAMAVEDAGALGCMLPYGTTPDEVPNRLKAYQELRKERDEFVSIESLQQATVPEKRTLVLRSEDIQDFLNGYDAIAVAQEHFNKTFGKT